MTFKMKNPLPVLKAVLEVYVKSSLSQAFFVLKLMVQDISSAQRSLFFVTRAHEPIIHFKKSPSHFMNLNLFQMNQVPPKKRNGKKNKHVQKPDWFPQGKTFGKIFPLSASLMLPNHHRLTLTGRTTKEFCRYKSGASVPNCWRWMWCLEGMVGWRFFLIGIYYSTSIMFNDLFLIFFYSFFFFLF